MCAHRVVAASQGFPPQSDTGTVFFVSVCAVPAQRVPLANPIGAQRTTFNMPAWRRRAQATATLHTAWSWCVLQYPKRGTSNLQHAMLHFGSCMFCCTFCCTSLQATANFGADERIASSSAAERPPSIKPALGLSWANCVRMASICTTRAAQKTTPNKTTRPSMLRRKRSTNAAETWRSVHSTRTCASAKGISRGAVDRPTRTRGC